MDASYAYRARILRVIDGDTFDVEVDAGFRIYARMPLRLAGVDAPERNTPESAATVAYVVGVLGPLPSSVVVRTLKPSDSFGRYLADVWVGELDLGAQLLALGLAAPYPR